MNPHTFTRLLWQLPVLTWLIILLLFLILITYVPWISLVLPNWLGMT